MIQSSGKSNSRGKRIPWWSFSKTWALDPIVISLLTCFAGPPPSAAQNNQYSPARPPIVYVSNAGGGITDVDAASNSVIATAPFANNANSVARSKSPKEKLNVRLPPSSQVMLAEQPVPSYVAPAPRSETKLRIHA
jgi:hypothetical protein